MHIHTYIYICVYVILIVVTLTNAGLQRGWEDGEGSCSGLKAATCASQHTRTGVNHPSERILCLRLSLSYTQMCKNIRQLAEIMTV